MDTAELAFKAVAVLHGLLGLLLLSAASSNEFQEECFYSGVAPMAGTLKKYVSLTGAWALFGCGVAAFWSPATAVALAWISLGFWFLGGVVKLPWTRAFPQLCKGSAISFLVRVVLASALTSLLGGLDG
jgi:hypothetical protein